MSTDAAAASLVVVLRSNKMVLCFMLTGPVYFVCTVSLYVRHFYGVVTY